MITTRNGFYAVVILSLLIAIAAPRLVVAGETPSQEIMDAANAGMKAFLRSTDIDSFGISGVSRKEDLNDAVLREAFEIFTIPPQKLVPENSYLCKPFYPEVDPLITSTNRWIFSIGVNGKVTNAKVDVGLSEGKWKTIQFGVSSFPQLMEDLLRAWPRDSGYRLRFIRIRQVNSSIVEVSRNGKLVGLINPRGDLKQLLQPSQVLPRLCASLKRNMEEDERARARGEVIYR